MSGGWAGRPTVSRIVPKSCWISRIHPRRRVRIVRVESVMVTFRVLLCSPNHRGGLGDTGTMPGEVFVRHYRPAEQNGAAQVDGRKGSRGPGEGRSGDQSSVGDR